MCVSPYINIPIYRYTDMDTDDDDEIHNAILDRESAFWNADKSNGGYYLGLIGYDHGLMLSTVSVPTFLANPYERIHTYLKDCSFTDPTFLRPHIRLIQLRLMPSGEHLAVDKTHWIVWVQRRWRARYRKWLTDRIRRLSFRETHGRFF